MDGWDAVLWIVGGYLAVLALVRFMLARRTQALKELRERAAAEPRPVKPAPVAAENVVSGN
jgi:hypothetical protein